MCPDGAVIDAALPCAIVEPEPEDVEVSLSCAQQPLKVAVVKCTAVAQSFVTTFDFAWGDGNTEQYKGAGKVEPEHAYAGIPVGEVVQFTVTVRACEEETPNRRCGDRNTIVAVTG